MSNPKAKAQELYLKMEATIWGFEVKSTKTKKVVKQCALIAVDEKITSLEQIKHPANTKRTNRRIDRYIYELEEIKREIEIL